MNKTTGKIKEELRELISLYLEGSNEVVSEKLIEEELMNEEYELKDNLTIVEMQEIIEIASEASYHLWDLGNEDFYKIYRGYETREYNEFNRLFKEQLKKKRETNV